MGIWASFTKLIGANYRYNAGADRLGIGVNNLALVQPGRTVDADFFSPRYNVRRNFDSGFPTVPNTGQSLPHYDLRQGGLFLSGDIALQRLVEMKKNEKAK